ncbi:hypothetical protein HMPREF1411_00155 [Helicobacter pylori GAM250AFi]|nr:hypothetical protein HMPREF1411_00155 [Helicobacter pylori GAM250AFi]EMH13323.1 hypothetical protein HMPREF1412_01093 [Helicobacter pylori GAM250T]EMH14165.1 hypothetical protein HMPREF1414_00968 [Helicobacter pylori GAM252T]EMH15865.1 hypothetical protein HMPREF1413_00308 [Helicobacter pylori GAM252Bi]EMH49346.1 hypothetical protein HMPREF1439_00448 [Helicobacter pylori HP250AFiii]EMH50094.1 hypothetical protein HMPREF1438_00074 [Helicobacter pylori HP250AFii]EMH50731.1 hypothetical prote
MTKRAKLKAKLKMSNKRVGLTDLTYYQIISFLDCKQQHNSDKQ